MAVLSAQLPEKRWLSLRLNQWEGHFTGDFQAKERNLVSAEFNGHSSRNSLREEVRLDGTGYVYHPNLYQFAYGLGLGLNQNAIYRSHESSPYSQDSGWVRDVLYQSLLLPQKPYRLYLGYMKKYRRLDNNFFEDVESHSRQWSWRTGYRQPSWNVQTSYSSENREEFFGDRRVTLKEKRLLVTGGWGDRKTVNGSLQGGMTHSFREEKGLYTSDLTNWTFQGNLIIPFDEIGEKAITSSLLLNTITGDNDLTNISWNNTARTKLRRRLYGHTSYAFRYYDSGTSLLRTHTLQAGLNHQLYESLFSTVDGLLDLYGEPHSRRMEGKLPLQMNYKKHLPVGLLTANLGWTPNREWITYDGGMLLDQEMTHRFADGMTVLLTEPHILPGSIQVVSETGLIPFQVDYDYRVQAYGQGFEITRIPGGAIPDSALVLIRYQVEASPHQTVGYTHWSYGIGYSYQSWWGLQVGFTGSSLRLNTHSGGEFSIQDEKQDGTWYLKVDYSPFQGEITREFSTSKLTPYTRTTCRIRGIKGSHLSQYISLNYQISWEELPLRHDHQQIQFGNLEVFRRLSRALRGRISYGRRRIRGSLNDIQEEKWQAVLKYESRQVAVSLFYNYNHNLLFDSKELDQRWYLVVDLTP
ncbi:MAG: hypothetical protein D6762_09245 [Candidatus Neomarinimicrobiota bacterium]|nr:MAG: hypothetical protein D6762_09245 [Candidatus Neomarinimicrobiota bacterium]